VFELNNIYNMDCMEAMRCLPDNYFELAIVDPPYFTGPERREFYGRRVSTTGVQRLYRPVSQWQVPDEKYFNELIRVSQNQIIWGCNYYDYKFGPGRIVWDKCNGDTTFSDCEIAYCSIHDSVRLFRYLWNGMLQGKSISEGWLAQGNKRLNEKRIHPTQKPVNLYKWLLQKYAKKGDKILDTHVGSGSSLIACYDMGFDYMGFEIDTYYYELVQRRVTEHMAQIRIEDIIQEEIIV